MRYVLILLLLPVGLMAQSIPDILTVVQFGAIADGKTDNTNAFQNAIDSAAVKGGRVYIPSGKWLVSGSIKVKPGVSLIGTNEAPLSPYQLIGAVILATGGRDNEDADPLFELWNASSAKGFTVYYPEQQTNDVHPYPWTFYLRSPAIMHSTTEKRKETFDVTVENITLINSYNGIRCGPDENGRHRIMSVHGCVLRRGIVVDWVGDIGRIENIQFHSHYWFHPSTNGNWDEVFTYMQYNLEAFIFGRSDWEFVSNTFVFPAKVGYKFIKTGMGNCNGQFNGIAADATATAILVESIQSQGLLITNGQFNSHKVGASTEIIIDSSCDGSVRFANCGFWGPAEHNAVINGPANMSFNNCYFSTNYLSKDPARPNYSIVANKGKLQVTNCTFDGAQTDEVKQWNYTGAKKSPPCIQLNKGVRFAIITGNTGYKGVTVQNNIGANAILKDNEPAIK
ncbi:MAG: hypothetical protein H0W12_03925 [Chitinophagaceae bacterium]|nr:hypothetical protein [Chitinophagaceae bacterium]